MPPPDPPDGGAASCEDAQQRLQALSCLEGYGSIGPDGIPETADDKSFAQLCRELVIDFPGLTDPGCIVKAVDCTAARQCYEE